MNTLLNELALVIKTYYQPNFLNFLHTELADNNIRPQVEASHLQSGSLSRALTSKNQAAEYVSEGVGMWHYPQHFQLEQILQNTANTPALPSISKSQLSNLSEPAISAMLLGIGSNYQPYLNLANARKAICALSHDCIWSDTLFSPDYTASKTQSKPDYHNQCILLSSLYPNCQLADEEQQRAKLIYKELMPNFEQLRYQLKSIEQNQQRTVGSNEGWMSSEQYRKVTLDIDILAVHSQRQWHFIDSRLPLKPHEWVIMAMLLEKKDSRLLV